jgi:D-beta-D-heptose 7-phosphate kinase / D-beta-D-heptose 1-phosphate adenosyltransferase
MIGRSLRLTVVGDAFLDVDILGVTRESNPSATPVMDVGRRLSRAGGAGLVASMLRNDGHEVTLLTAISDDQSSASVVAHLEGVNVVAGELRGRTPVKTRLFEGSEVIGRFDEHCEPTAIPVFGRPDLSCLGDADAIVVADYARGVAAAPLIRARLDRLAGSMPIVWDPHARGARPTKNVSLVTPNADEARRLSGISGTDLNSSIDAADRLRREWGASAVAVTLGQDGASSPAAATIACTFRHLTRWPETPAAPGIASRPPSRPGSPRARTCPRPWTAPLTTLASSSRVAESHQ